MKRLTWLTITFSLAAANLAAQPSTDAPLRNLELPVFNEFGNRIWHLRAASARFLTEKADQIELATVHLRILTGDADGTLDAELFAPVALVDLSDKNNRTVSGKGQLHVIGRGMELFGNDWICYAATKSIVVERDVVITFTASLGNILR
jgi:hypothetical protein